MKVGALKNKQWSVFTFIILKFQKRKTYGNTHMTTIYCNCAT